MNYPAIGIDYHETITKDLQWFNTMVRAWQAQNIKVYMVTALKENPSQSAIDERENCLVKTDGIEYVYFKDYSEIAPLKLEVCIRLNIQVMFDDSPAVCKLLANHGILTAQIRKSVVEYPL